MGRLSVEKTKPELLNEKCFQFQWVFEIVAKL